MKLDIVKNAKQNMLSGMVSKLVTMLCPFITKMEKY
jgi:hypothetical protein